MSERRAPRLLRLLEQAELLFLRNSCAGESALCCTCACVCVCVWGKEEGLPGWWGKAVDFGPSYLFLSGSEAWDLWVLPQTRVHPESMVKGQTVSGLR